MKLILYTFFFLISIVGISQEKMNGKYCSMPMGESGVTCLDFKENNRFEYVLTDCLGVSALGSGKFILDGTSLKLIFDKAKQKPKNKFEITETKTDSKKEVKLKFNIKDKNGFMLPANVIRTTYREHFFYDEMNEVFLVDKNSPKAIYSIELIGYKTLLLDLDNLTNKVIDVVLFSIQPKIISEKELTIRWTKINNDEFETGPNTWNRYKKVRIENSKGK